MTLAGNMYSGRIYLPISHSLRLHRKLVSSDSRSLPSLPAVCMCSGQSSDGLRVGYKAPPQSPLFSKIQPLPLKYHSSHSLPKLHSLLCGKLLLRQHAIFFCLLIVKVPKSEVSWGLAFCSSKILCDLKKLGSYKAWLSKDAWLIGILTYLFRIQLISSFSATYLYPSPNADSPLLHKGWKPLTSRSATRQYRRKKQFSPNCIPQQEE